MGGRVVVLVVATAGPLPKREEAAMWSRSLSVFWFILYGVSDSGSCSCYYVPDFIFHVQIGW